MVTVGSKPAQSAADWVLTTTRSVRKGLDTTREVPRELLEDCLRVAMQAPGASNVLYPHFVVVTDPAKRTALGGFYKRAWDAYLSGSRFLGRQRPFRGPDPRGAAAPCHRFCGLPGRTLGRRSRAGIPVYHPAGGWAAPVGPSFDLGFRSTSSPGVLVARGARAWTCLSLDNAPACSSRKRWQRSWTSITPRCMQAALIPVAYSLAG